MPQSLLEQLPELVVRGRRQAEKILENLNGPYRAKLQTLEWIPQSPGPRLRNNGNAFARQQAQHDAKADANWSNRLIDGNNLRAMAALLAGDEHTPNLRGKIDLVYIDLPFAPKAVRHAGAIWPDMDRQAPITRQPSALDRWPDETAAHLRQIIPQLILVRELLSANGSIFIHLDWHVGHLVKLLLDDLFGKDNFRNEIALPNQVARHLQIRRDHLFWYTKSAAASFPPLWLQEHAGDGSESRWDHFWDTTDHPAMRYSLFGITPTLGRWTWEEARALKAIRNYERFCEEGRGRTIEQYWCDTGATLEFLRPSPDDGVPQYWREPAGERKDHATPAGPDTRGHLAGSNETYLAQIIEFATRQHGIVAGFGGGAAPAAPVAEKLGRRWLVAGLDKPACTAVRKRLLDQGTQPFLYQAVDV